MTRRWCTLEGGFLSYYESERSAAALGRVDVGEVVSLAVHNTETMTGAGNILTYTCRRAGAVRGSEAGSWKSNPGRNANDASDDTWRLTNNLSVSSLLSKLDMSSKDQLSSLKS